MKKALMISSVASMIKQFNMHNISILQRMGFEVTVGTNFKDSGTIPIEEANKLLIDLNNLGVNTIQLDMNRNPLHPENRKVLSRLTRYLDNNYFDIIHCHSPIGGVITRLAAKSTRKTGTKVIYTAHGFHFYDGAPIKYWWTIYPVEKILSKVTDILITINQEDYNRAKEKLNAKITHYVPGVGVDLKKFAKQTDKKKSELRKKYKIEQDDFILFYAAELSNRKNQQMLLEVMNNIKSFSPKIKLLLAGQGDNKQLLMEYIQNHDLENVSLLGYRDDVINLMQLSNVVVSTSRQEGLPVNIMEAMATGLPLIVTNSRGNRDLVVNGENGYLVDLDNIDSFTDKIKMLYTNSNLQKKFGDKSLDLVQEYSREKIDDMMNNIYLSFLKKD